VPVAAPCERLSMTFVVRRCFQCSAESLKASSASRSLIRHSTALSLFDAPGLDEGVEGRKRIFLGLGHPDFLQRPLAFGCWLCRAVC